jgi:hypothetical protein
MPLKGLKTFITAAALSVAILITVARKKKITNSVKISITSPLYPGRFPV